jgi:hypothetical protein
MGREWCVFLVADREGFKPKSEDSRHSLWFCREGERQEFEGSDEGLLALT